YLVLIFATPMVALIFRSRPSEMRHRFRRSCCTAIGRKRQRPAISASHRTRGIRCGFHLRLNRTDCVRAICDATLPWDLFRPADVEQGCLCDLEASSESSFRSELGDLY